MNLLLNSATSYDQENNDREKRKHEASQKKLSANKDFVFYSSKGNKQNNILSNTQACSQNHVDSVRSASKQAKSTHAHSNHKPNIQQTTPNQNDSHNKSVQHRNEPSQNSIDKLFNESGGSESDSSVEAIKRVSAIAHRKSVQITKNNSDIIRHSKDTEVCALRDVISERDRLISDKDKAIAKLRDDLKAEKDKNNELIERYEKLEETLGLSDIFLAELSYPFLSLYYFLTVF
jgi:hypothetical protein